MLLRLLAEEPEKVLSVTVSQLSFFSAESVPPEVTDLAGLLAGPGQVVVSGAGARISVVVDQPWRALALAEMITETGLQAEVGHTETGTENHPLVRTAIDPAILPIAREWTRGAVKTVPAQWLPGARELRAWVLAAGSPEADRYLLGLDPHAPDTHSPLAAALMRVGIAPTLIGTRGANPALRISGRRRLGRLLENIGEPPGDTDAFRVWPRV
ncbi:Uncharacterised protein [Mycobacteroides abscessus]|uniref:Uncharacterized protein n=4 Tax=Mycobacteroides abscessus TaxID=36809 RepID=A0A0U0ZUW6_9MYCO|nr:hypothetical protein MASS_0458 [Mycobacteroides abscessus subsp. bolletii 50594]AWG56143.1 hypothetical protein DDT53_19255 [Mycobacteroides abscessus]EPQ25170.1 hypothetical protein J108_02335 [Mycobacteroides abscessus subsp. bolletii CRM-0020]QCO28032.1 hypothetical protein CFE69_20985 [Mycobacteroides abscessus subsp. massiliense]SHQ18351.1 Uncharacterised protein [Mycobacteroides abscessus subsp. abscessus]